MKEPQPHDSQNQIIEPSDYRYITIRIISITLLCSVLTAFVDNWTDVHKSACSVLIFNIFVCFLDQELIPYCYSSCCCCSCWGDHLQKA